MAVSENDFFYLADWTRRVHRAFVILLRRPTRTPARDARRSRTLDVRGTRGAYT